MATTSTATTSEMTPCLSSSLSTAASPLLRITLIAALSPSNGLGISGGLAWSLKGEMAYFRKATMSLPPNAKGKNAVIMGRNTWQSIPSKFRPLKGRINVVVSSNVGEERERQLGISSSQDSYLVSSLPSAISLLKSFPSAFVADPVVSSPTPLARTFLIGGAQLYTQALQSLTDTTVSSLNDSPPTAAAAPAIMDRLLITRLLSPEYNCDVFLPEFRSRRQIKQDRSLSSSSSSFSSNIDLERTEKTSIIDKDTKEQEEEEEEVEEEEKWTKSSQEELQNFLGPQVDFQRGIVSEKQEGQREETKYEFQLWKR